MIVDISGATLRELPVSKDAGLYRIAWDLRPGTRPGNAPNAPRSTRSTEQGGEADRPAGEGAPRRQRRGTDPEGGPRGGEANPAGGNQSGEATTDRPRGGGFAGRRAAGLSLGPGTYRVVLTVDGKEFAQNLRVEADPVVADAVAGIDQPYADTEEEEEEEMDQPGGMMEEEREHELIRVIDRREPDVDR